MLNLTEELSSKSWRVIRDSLYVQWYLGYIQEWIVAAKVQRADLMRTGAYSLQIAVLMRLQHSQVASLSRSC